MKTIADLKNIFFDVHPTLIDDIIKNYNEILLENLETVSKKYYEENKINDKQSNLLIKLEGVYTCIEIIKNLSKKV